MSFYDSSAWSPHSRQQSWDQQAPSRSGNSSTVQREEPNAFASQYEEIVRASENLLKSGRAFSMHGAGRRESMPLAGSFARQFPDYEARGGGPQRHHSVSEYDGGRASSSSSLQGYIANQRYGPRQSEAEQVMQAKRRMAAQRERELRNYHQEQQYNRHLSGAKSDRSLSPSSMNEEDRRELIARQHRALYGNDSNMYMPDGQVPRPSQDARVAAGLLGGPQQSFDPYSISGANSGEPPSAREPPTSSVSGKEQQTSTGHQEPRANSSSPSGNPAFNPYENSQQQPGHTSNSSPTGGSPHLQGTKGSAPSGVAPIGTRPAQTSSATTGAQQRNTPPMSASLGYGFNNERPNVSAAERSNSASSNPQSSAGEKSVNLGWGSNNGVWGSGKNPLGVWG